jgi:hypothetical protein
MSDTKKCSKCGEVKGLGEFFADRTKKDGLRPSCKVCTIKKCDEYRAKNPEKARAQRAAWAAANRTKANSSSLASARKRGYAAQRKWQRHNSEAIQQAAAKWREANPEKVRAKNARSQERLPRARVASMLKMRVDEAPPELIALKREQLAIKRMARELKKAATKPTGENE